MARLPVQLSLRERDACTRLAEALSPAFGWAKTPQGRAYWEEVKRNLYGLAAFEVYPYNEETGEPGDIGDEIPEEDNRELNEDDDDDPGLL